MKSILTFEKPAYRWIEGTPLGNGHMGFMHYTTDNKEIFAFNHDSLFRQNISKEIKTKDVIEEIRQLIKKDDFEKAQNIFKDAVKGVPERCNPYQPLANLVFDFEENESYKKYKRTLDLRKAIMNVSYECENHLLQFETFVSNPRGLAIIRMFCDKKRTAQLSWNRKEDCECKTFVDYVDGQMNFKGCFIEEKKFFASLKVDSDGSVSYDSQGIICRDFTELVVYVKAGLGTPDKLDDIYDYDEIKKEHINDFESIYNRFSFSLDDDALQNSEEVYKQSVYSKDIHTDMYEYIMNMARYVMISSSRDGSKPMNLQALWCDDIQPEWDCGYTTDINIQMCYWMANALNLRECQIPLFDWIISNIDTLKLMAMEIFGADEAVYVPQYTDLYMTPTCWKDFSPFQILWSGAATWIAEHFFEYWKYSADNEFMMNVGYPYMKMCATFYLELLEKNNKGVYELIPACNPENWTSNGAQIMKTTAMDIALVHELMDNLIYANEKLNINDDKIDKWIDINQNIESYYVDEDGALSEFSTRETPADPYHRHLSHLYGLYPAKTFIHNKKLTVAAKKAIAKRLEKGLINSATWSMAWYSCCFARMCEGNTALEYIDHIVKGGLMENFLTSHNDWRENSEYSMLVSKKIFQVEGLMGAAAAMAEMLISCDNERTVILPALPDRWRNGKVCGLCGYGSFDYDIEWKDNKVKNVVIHSKKGGNLTLKIATSYKSISCSHKYEQEKGLIILDKIEENEKINIIVEE